MKINDNTPEIFCYEQVSSAIDTAFELAGEGRLEPFGSVLAESQTSGRGQTRRFWVSPPGNIYAALLLPDDPLFNSSASAVVVAFILAQSLNLLGFSVKIKWPNDLILLYGARPHKIGGILVEQRGKNIVAGIGINLTSSPEPEQLREGGLPAGCLDSGPVLRDTSSDGIFRSSHVREEHTSFAENLPSSPDTKLARYPLWRYLVRESCKWYNASRKNSAEWFKPASELLLWKGVAVNFDDDGEIYGGILARLAPSGGIILRCADGEREFTSGSFYRRYLKTAHGNNK